MIFSSYRKFLHKKKTVPLKLNLKMPNPVWVQSLSIAKVSGLQSMFKGRWITGSGYSYQFWHGAFEPHILKSTQCSCIPAPSVSSRSRIHQSGIAAGRHSH